MLDRLFLLQYEEMVSLQSLKVFFSLMSIKESYKILIKLFQLKSLAFL